MGEEFELSEDAIKIAEERIRAMPAHLEMHIGGYSSFDKYELLKHIEKRDKIGKIAVETEIEALRFFKKG